MKFHLVTVNVSSGHHHQWRITEHASYSRTELCDLRSRCISLPEVSIPEERATAFSLRDEKLVIRCAKSSSPGVRRHIDL